MSESYLITDLNLNGINANTKHTYIPKRFNMFIPDFNKRYITSNNIEYIVLLAQYLVIEDIPSFIFKYIEPTFDYEKLYFTKMEYPPFVNNKCHIRTAFEYKNIKYINYYINKAIGAKLICSLCAEFGLLPQLKLAHEKGYIWDTSTTFNAALRGHIQCLQYACRNGCPVSDNAYNAAAFYNNTHIVEFLYLQGCPPSNDYFEIAFENESFDCIAFGVKHKFPNHKKYFWIKNKHVE